MSSENININGTVNVGLEEFENNANSPPPSTTDALFQVFSQSNIVIILWFLAVYFVVYILLSIFRGSENTKSSMTRWIDIVSLMCVLAYLVSTFFTKTDADKTKMINDLYSQLETSLNSPLTLISVGFFILTLYIVIYILEVPMDSVGKPITISIIENMAWVYFVIVVLVTFLRFVAGVSITDLLEKIWNYLQNRADASLNGNVIVRGNTVVPSRKPEPVVMDEVFNIGNNMYTYDDAKSVCASMGARLANYDEVESSYEKGAEWCNYGWSDGQAAYFPTQKDTWAKLQKNESTKNSCGRPGINGGYIDNPNVRFGVNCYGKKPQPKPGDLAKLGNNALPKTAEDLVLDKKIQFWKDNGDKLFKINGYNNNKWSMY